MKAAKRSIIACVLALVLCVAMFVGTTFAWFSDTITNEGNVIQSGTLDIGATVYNSGNGSKVVSIDNTNYNFENEGLDLETAEGPFITETNWVPGFSNEKYITVTNKGSISAVVSFEFENETRYNKNDIEEALWFVFLPVNSDNSVNGVALQRPMAEIGDVAEDKYTLAPESSINFVLLYGMNENAGNEFQNGEFEATLTINATQENEVAIGGTTVGTADELQSAIAEGGNITLGADISADLFDKYIDDTKINLNGHTLTIAGEPDKTIAPADGKTLIVENGNIVSNLSAESGLTGLFSAGADSTLVLRNINLQANRTIVTLGSNNVPDVSSNARVIIENSTLYTSSYYGLGTNASSEFECYYDIKNSSITADYTDGDCAALLFNVKGGVTAENSTFTAGRQAAIIRGGNGIFTNCLITNTGKSSLVNEYTDSDWKDGNNLPMAALVVGDRGNSYQYSVNVSLRSCELVSEKDNVPAIYIWGDSEEYSATLNYDSATSFQAKTQIAGKAKDGSSVIINGNVKAVVTDTAEFNDIENLSGSVVLGNDVNLSIAGYSTVMEVQPDKKVTLNLNNKNITLDDITHNSIFYAMAVQGGTLTINGNGVVDASPAGGFCIATYESEDNTIVINGGTFIGETSVIQLGCLGYAGSGKSICKINGGFFRATGYEEGQPATYLLNCLDSVYSAGNGEFIIKGGTFVNFDPSNVTSEPGASISWVASGYTVKSEEQDNGETWYTVVKA